MAMYAQCGQKIVVPALNKLCLNDILGFDIASQSFFLKRVYGYYYHLAGFVSSSSPNWTRFSFQKCESENLMTAANQFPTGLTSKDITTLIYLRLIQFNWDTNSLQDIEDEVLSELIRILKYDSVENRDMEAVGGVSARGLAKKKAEASSSDTLSGCGIELASCFQGNGSERLHHGRVFGKNPTCRVMCWRFQLSEAVHAKIQSVDSYPHELDTLIRSIH